MTPDRVQLLDEVGEVVREVVVGDVVAG